MKDASPISRATLGRLPQYLFFLRKVLPKHKTISATAVSRALGYGEVQVRKDLGAVCGIGKPKIGYETEVLIHSIEQYLSGADICRAVIVGAGKLGGALLDYGGFSDFGIEIIAAFDIDAAKCGQSPCGKPIYPMEELESICRAEEVRIGIITARASAAQTICDRLCDGGVRAVWNFAPAKVSAPADVIVREENLALSLAHLKVISEHKNQDTE